MDTPEQETIEGRRRQLDSKRFCLECGAVMKEADRLVEGRALFASYTYSEVGCDTRWLRKFSKEPQNV